MIRPEGYKILFQPDRIDSNPGSIKLVFLSVHHHCTITLDFTYSLTIEPSYFQLTIFLLLQCNYLIHSGTFLDLGNSPQN